MFTFFLLIIFFGILFFFGWQLARFILSEKRIEALIPIASVLGFSIYLFSLNLLSYLIDIRINFYLLLAVFIFLSYFLYKVNRKKEKAEWGIGKSWRIILFGTCLLMMILVGIIGVRTIDEDSLVHDPVAVTIAEGNFPVRDVIAPDYFSQDHYAYNLFSAAIFKITNLPVWYGHDFQNFILIGILFLFGFLLIKDFCKDNFKAYLASLTMILGGNLNFLYGIGGLSSLYQKYILNLPVEAPFRFLNDMLFGRDIRGLLVVVHSQTAWIMLGFVLTIAVIYLYFRAVQDKGNWLKISLLAGMLFSFLALSAEIFFGALAIVLLIYPFILAILKKDWQASKIYFKISLLILFLGGLVAVFQGGVVSQTAKQILFGYSSPVQHHFSITLEYLLKGLMVPHTDSYVSIFSSTVFLAWGWLFIFIVPVAIFLLRRHFQLALLLISLIFISFFLPLVVIAGGLWHGDFLRVNYLTSLAWNLIFGLFLGWLLLSRPFFGKRAGWQKLLIIVLILGVVFQGLFYFALFPAFPYLQKNQPLFGDLKLSPAEITAVNWIKNNTTIKDYFLDFGRCNSTRFVMTTGRLAPNFYFYAGGCDRGSDRTFESLNLNPMLIPQITEYGKILKECDSVALKTLGFAYLYIDENWPEGLEERCLLNNDLILKLETGEGNKFIRIYEILNH